MTWDNKFIAVLCIGMFILTTFVVIPVVHNQSKIPDNMNLGWGINSITELLGISSLIWIGMALYFWCNLDEKYKIFNNGGSKQ